LRWRDGEIVIADTLPIELSAQIGVGVFFGASWDMPDFRPKPRADFVRRLVGVD
jgi:hypothetical protein